MMNHPTHDVPNPTTTRQKLLSRQGLSKVEFVSCAAAVIGGAWIGIAYMGVDVEHAAHTALVETRLLDKVPPEYRPRGPQEGVTREQLVATLREELGSLRDEINNLRTGAPPANDSWTKNDRALETPVGNRGSATLPPDKDKSLAFWARVNEVALGEASLQVDAEAAFDETNASKVFAIKSRIGRFAAKTLETLPREEVDPSLVQFALQLGEWYQRGGELYDRAVQIWESAASSQGRQQLNSDWKRAELQHKNEAHLLRDKAEAVRTAASRRFGFEFPPFASNATQQEAQK